MPLYPSVHPRNCPDAPCVHPHPCPQTEGLPDTYLHIWHTRNSRVDTGCTHRGLCVPSCAFTPLEMKISCLTTFLNPCLPACCSPSLGGTREEQSPLRVMHNRKPYLSTSHHGECHLVPKVKLSTCKLHGPLQALRGGRRLVSTSLPGHPPAHPALPG